MSKVGLLLALCVMMLSAKALSPYELRYLAGLDNIRVIVNLERYADTCLNQYALQSRIVSKVCQTGIHVVDSDTSAAAFLEMHILALRRDIYGVPTYVCYASMDLEQPAVLKRLPLVTYDMLCFGTNLEYGPSSSFADDMDTLVDQFTSDFVISYLLANKGK